MGLRGFLSCNNNQATIPALLSYLRGHVAREYQAFCRVPIRAMHRTRGVPALRSEPGVSPTFSSSTAEPAFPPLMAELMLKASDNADSNMQARSNN